MLGRSKPIEATATGTVLAGASVSASGRTTFNPVDTSAQAQIDALRKNLERFQDDFDNARQGIRKEMRALVAKIEEERSAREKTLPSSAC